MGVVWASLGCGMLFGAGLTVSQMINPGKVIGFLDFAGQWDPTLAVVMVSALAVAIPGFWLVRQRASPVIAHAFQFPARRDIDGRLLGGAVLFGMGWGMAGLCPGPAIAGLSLGVWQVGVFVLAMIAGMIAERVFSGMRGT